MATNPSAQQDKRTQQLLNQQAGPKSNYADIQAIQNQIQAINAERAQNHALARQSIKANAQMAQFANNAGQALMVGGAGGVAASTGATMAKYGMPVRQSTSQRNTQVVRQGPSTIHITNNNITTNNNGGLPQGRAISFKDQSAAATAQQGRFKQWISNVFSKQTEENRYRERQFEQRDWSLRKQVNKLVGKMEGMGRTVMENLDPRGFGTTVTSQFKTIMLLFGARFLAQNFTKVIRVTHKISNFFEKALDWFGITKAGKQLNAQGAAGSIRGDLYYFFTGSYPKKGDTIIGLFKQLFDEILEHIGIWFEVQMKKRSIAMKSVKFPELKLGDQQSTGDGMLDGMIAQLGIVLTRTFSGVTTYLGDILNALVSPESSINKTAMSNVKNEGLKQSYNASLREDEPNMWQNSSQNGDVNMGDYSLVATSSKGKRQYHLNQNAVDLGTGKLITGEGAAGAQVSQARDILGAYNDAKDYGVINTGRLLGGLQRLYEAARSQGSVIVDDEFMQKMFGTTKVAGAKPVAMKFVEADMSAMDQGFEREYAARKYGATGWVSGLASGAMKGGTGYLFDQIENPKGMAYGTAAAAGTANALYNKTGKYIKAGTKALGKVVKADTAIGAAIGLTQGIRAENELNKKKYILVPANDARPAAIPGTHTFYSLSTEALNQLAKKSFKSDSFDSDNINVLLGQANNQLINYGGGAAEVNKQWRMVGKNSGLFEKQHDVSIHQIREQTAAMQKLMEEGDARLKNSRFSQTMSIVTNNLKAGVNNAIDGVNNFAANGYGLNVDPGDYKPIRITKSDQVRNANYIMNRLMSEAGLTREQAAGIVGNIMAESSCNPSTYVKNDNGGPSGGIIGWHDDYVRGYDRFTSLKKFAASKGRPWNDLQTQVDFLIHQDPYTRKAINIIRKDGGGVGRSAYLWGYHAEKFQGFDKGPNHPEYIKRAKFARGVLEIHTGGQIAAPVTMHPAPTPGMQGEFASNPVPTASTNTYVSASTNSASSQYSYSGGGSGGSMSFPSSVGNNTSNYGGGDVGSQYYSGNAGGSNSVSQVCGSAGSGTNAVREWLWGGPDYPRTFTGKGTPAERRMSSYIVEVPIPCRDPKGKPYTHTIKMHQKLAENIQGVFKEIFQKTTFRVNPRDTYGYSYRAASTGRGSNPAKKLSNHAFGSALDVNPTVNALYAKDGHDDDMRIRTSSHPVVRIFNANGWTWGGIWRSYDPMHFEFTNGAASGRGSGSSSGFEYASSGGGGFSMSGGGDGGSGPIPESWKFDVESPEQIKETFAGNREAFTIWKAHDGKIIAQDGSGYFKSLDAFSNFYSNLDKEEKEAMLEVANTKTGAAALYSKLNKNYHLKQNLSGIERERHFEEVNPYMKDSESFEKWYAGLTDRQREAANKFINHTNALDTDSQFKKWFDRYVSYEDSPFKSKFYSSKFIDVDFFGRRHYKMDAIRDYYRGVLNGDIRDGEDISASVRYNDEFNLIAWQEKELAKIEKTRDLTEEELKLKERVRAEKESLYKKVNSFEANVEAGADIATKGIYLDYEQNSAKKLDELEEISNTKKGLEEKYKKLREENVYDLGAELIDASEWKRREKEEFDNLVKREKELNKELDDMAAKAGKDVKAERKKRNQKFKYLMEGEDGVIKSFEEAREQGKSVIATIDQLIENYGKEVAVEVAKKKVDSTITEKDLDKDYKASEDPEFQKRFQNISNKTSDFELATLNQEFQNRVKRDIALGKNISQQTRDMYNSLSNASAVEMRRNNAILAGGIREIISENGLKNRDQTIRELSQELGYSIGELIKMEKGTAMLNTQAIVTVIQALGSKLDNQISLLGQIRDDSSAFTPFYMYNNNNTAPLLTRNLVAEALNLGNGLGTPAAYGNSNNMFSNRYKALNQLEQNRAYLNDINKPSAAATNLWNGMMSKYGVK